MAETVCHHCSKRIPKGSPRTIRNSLWVCEDCAYLIEHPNAARLPKPVRVNKLRPQAEQLFDDAA